MILEDHTSEVTALCFSPDGRLLASRAECIKLWRTDTWECIANIDARMSTKWTPGLAFHPTEPYLAAVCDDDESIRIWKCDLAAITAPARPTPSVFYTNAKVVVVGEHSTGKTCLIRALLGEPFSPQESTHGMKIWRLLHEKVQRPEKSTVERETLLWDLAGQVDYQIIHQLFLEQSSLGIILFDSTHPENPFAGVAHWEKALRRAAGERCPMILVAGRVDRGRPTVTSDDIEDVRTGHGFKFFVQTSAKTHEGVSSLRDAIATHIPWNRLPITRSPKLWQDLRQYILERRDSPDALVRKPELLESFRRAYDSSIETAEFDTVISHAQAQGLVWRLSYGDFILLKPELLNDYASAVVRAARKETQGLGCVTERDVLEAKVDFEDLPRLSDPSAERILLHSVVELFLDREIALREGDQLVFPSKFNRRRPDHPEPPPRDVAYRFAGPVEDIYATLVVRITYSGAFELRKLWKNAADFTTSGGGHCSLKLDLSEEGQAELSIYFEANLSTDSKVLLIRFVHDHLHKRATVGSVTRERIYRCLNCGREVLDRQAVVDRLKRGRTTIPCLTCDDIKIDLFDLLEEKFGDPELMKEVRKLDKEAEAKKSQEVGVTKAQAKEVLYEFDVFLAHNSLDKPMVLSLAALLRQRGLSPWIDKEQIPPGRWFQDVIQQAIPSVRSAAIIIGVHGLGRWQTVELRSFISQCVEQGMPVIPVLLPGVTSLPPELFFLKELNYVQFTNIIEDKEVIDFLQWGITGERPKDANDLISK